MTDLEKLKKYLTENDNEILNKYIRGYISAAQITKNVGVVRNLFYAVDIPDMVLKKEEYEKNAMVELVKRINRALPFENMKIDKNCLLGKEDISNLSMSVQKDKIRKKRNTFEVSFDKGFALTQQSKVNVWYRYYLTNEERKRGKEKPFNIAKMYGLPVSKIYEVMAFLRENEAEGRFLVGVPLDEQEIILENIKIFESYQNGSTINEISDKWKIEEPLIDEVIETFTIAKENLVKPKNNNGK